MELHHYLLARCAGDPGVYRLILSVSANPK